MSERKPVLGIAFVISEPIQAEGLPILEVYRTDDGYVLGQGTELVVSALKKSISNLGTSNHTRGEKKLGGLSTVDGRTQTLMNGFQDPLVFNSFNTVIFLAIDVRTAQERTSGGAE